MESPIAGDRFSVSMEISTCSPGTPEVLLTVTAGAFSCAAAEGREKVSNRQTATNADKSRWEIFCAFIKKTPSFK